MPVLSALLLSGAALAGDAHATLTAPSMAPLENTAQVDAIGVGALGLVPGWTIGQGSAGLRGTTDLSERVRLEAVSMASYSLMYTWHDGDEGGNIDGYARVGVAVLERPNLRVGLHAAAGTVVQGGLSVWWRSKDEVFEFDAGWAASFRADWVAPETWEHVNASGPVFSVQGLASIPELGLTWHVAGPHHLRFGHFGPVPTVSYRLDRGRGLHGGITVGTIGVGSVARLQVGSSF